MGGHQVNHRPRPVFQRAIAQPGGDQGAARSSPCQTTTLVLPVSTSSDEADANFAVPGRCR